LYSGGKFGIIGKNQNIQELEESTVSIGLVLEGGGMRGAYTSGVLDVFLDEEIFFPKVYGVSAGACNALSYVSRQKGRNRQIFSKYATDNRYVSVKNLQEKGSLFDFDFLFGELFHELIPFDYQTFYHSSMQLFVGATDLMSGMEVYYPKESLDETFTAVKASSSLPFLSQVVKLDGKFLLDGGIAAPIPLERSIFDGNQFHVVVLTRDYSYRKDLKPDFSPAMLRTVYGQYPGMISAMMVRPETYNSELQVVRRQEQAGKVLAIRPSRPIDISRYEKDPQKLENIYQLGVQDAKKKLPQIWDLMKQSN
jgi:predicted patatin/cPLA2 family phospholipase